MAKRYRYEQPSRAKGSPVLSMSAMRDYVATMNLLVHKFPQRMEKGRELFLLAMAEQVRSEVQRFAPEIKFGESEIPYAQDLRIAIVDGADNDMESVAIYFEGKEVALTAETADGKALFFRPKQGSPKWVDVLMMYGPWPSYMVPVDVKEGDAVVVSRNARPDELNRLADRIYVRRGGIESALRKAGAAKVTIDKTDKAVGIVVNEDVGYNILKVEFGYDDSKSVAHWRPALKSIKEKVPGLMNRYIKYLITGKETVFALPGDVGKIGQMKLSKSDKFMKTLAPFAPSGVVDR